MRRILCLSIAVMIALPVHAASKKSRQSHKKQTISQLKKYGGKRVAKKRQTASGKRVASQRSKKPAAPKAGYCAAGGSNKVSTSMYFLPQRQDYATERAFLADVKMQGSGILKDGRIKHYLGGTSRRPANCGTTVTSASGQCLMSYFSVAADLRYHRAGDIICIPEIAEKKIRVKIPETGQVVTHPGCFEVADTGGVIRGPNRFDIFTGTDNPLEKGNPFLNIGLADKKSCDKEFVKLERGSPRAINEMATIAALNEKPLTQYAENRRRPMGDSMLSSSAESAQ